MIASTINSFWVHFSFQIFKHILNITDMIISCIVIVVTSLGGGYYLVIVNVSFSRAQPENGCWPHLYLSGISGGGIVSWYQLCFGWFDLFWQV